MTGVAENKRPSQIAGRLKLPQQNLYYHYKPLMEAGLIAKDRDSGNLVWRLTPMGHGILKDMVRWCVNHGTAPRQGSRTVRMHNAAFVFKVMTELESIPELRWIEMKNGVSKCNLTKDNSFRPILDEEYTVELLMSDKGCVRMFVHLQEKHFLDPNRACISRYDDARDIAKLFAQRLNIEISDRGNFLKRPHFAFENDMAAWYIATFETAEISTNGSDGARAWIDSSRGKGEFETNDVDYADLYLQMPAAIEELREAVRRISRTQEACWRAHYDPTLTRNN